VAPPSAWRVEFVAGAVPLNARANLDLAVTSRGVSGTRFGRERFSIPARSILRVAYDNARYRPVTGWVEESLTALSSVDSGAGFVLIPMLAVMVVGVFILAPVQTTHHYVQIYWLDHGEPRDIIVQVDGGDRLEILNALAEVHGHPWDDMPEMRRHIVRRLEAGEGDRFDIDLARDARFPGGRLDAGAYRVVALASPEGRADILFFPRDHGKDGGGTGDGAMDAAGIVAQTVAAVEPVSGGVGLAATALVDGPEGDTLDALLSPAASYRLARRSIAGSVGAAPGSGPPGRRFAAGGGLYLAALLVPHGGESCLRLPALKHTFAMSSGLLYLCRNRIVFEPMQSTAPFGAGHDPISFRRSEVTSLDPGRRLGAVTLRVKGADDTVVFLPVFEGVADPDGPSWKERQKVTDRFFSWLALCWRDFPACEADLLGGGEGDDGAATTGDGTPPAEPPVEPPARPPAAP
jgi:hypothetical protein